MHHRSTRFLAATASVLLAFSTQAAWAQAPSATQASHGSFTLWELLTAGGWVMLPLAAASLAVASLVLYAFMTLKSDAVVTSEFLVRADAFLDNEDLPGLANAVAERPQAVARVLDAMLQFTDRRPDAGADAVNAVAETEAGRIASQMNQRALWIMDVGVMAPMLGLLGTVVGILRSFGSLSQEGATPMRTMLLAGGVSQALVATACGLVVGIAAMGFYAFFRARVQELVSLLEQHATRLVNEAIVIHQKRRPLT